MAARTCHQAGLDVTLYEKAPYAGGHILTDYRDLGSEVFPFEVGVFMFDPVSMHPKMYGLAKELGMTPVEIDFSVTHEIPEKEIFWTTEPQLPLNLRQFSVLYSVLQRGNKYENLKYTYDIYRFYKDTGKLSSEHPLSKSDMKTLQASGEFRGEMFEDWLYPLMLCWWGIPEDKAPDCSVDVITDSMYRVSNHPQYVFKEGWHAFVERIMDPFKEILKTGKQVDKVERTSKDIEVSVDGKKEQYDHVIFATPPCQTTKLLASPFNDETSLLSNFETVTTDIYFHTDDSWMPKDSRWGLINYTKDTRGNFVTFWHGKLQKDQVPYFISWGDRLKELPDPQKTLNTARMLRTIPTMGYRNNTCKFNTIQGRGNIWHCGAHVDSIVTTHHMPVPSLWHENAFMSGLRVGNQIVNLNKKQGSHVYAN